MKERLSREVISMRIASELQDGEVVNIGYGIVDNLSSFVPPGRDVIFHSENGLIGFGRLLTTEDPVEHLDYNLMNAGSRFVEAMPGMVLFDIAEAFACVRNGCLDTTVLGAYQVSEKGDLANWSLDPKGTWGSIGGAMDMPLGAKRVIVGMEHTDKEDRPKIVRKLSLPMTAKECVKLIVTDLAVIAVTPEGLVLKEVAPGWTPEEVQSLTEPRLIMRDVKEMTL